MIRSYKNGKDQREFYKYVETDKNEKRREGYSIRWTMRTKATRCFYYGKKRPHLCSQLGVNRMPCFSQGI